MPSFKTQRPVPFKVIILGQDNIDKATLCGQLADPKYAPPAAENYSELIGANFQALKTAKIDIQLWELSAKERYETIVSMHCNNAQLTIYCVDLSQDSNQNTGYQSMDESIGRFREKNPTSPILLVGTNGDAHPDAQQRLSTIQQRSNHSFAQVFVTSSHQMDGTEQLRHFIIAEANRISFTSNTHFLAQANIPENTSLYDALQQLALEANKLGVNTKEAMEAAVTTLITGLLNPEIDDKNQLIIDFTEQCTSYIPAQNNALIKAAFCVAISALTIVLVGAIGFGLGFALGSLFAPTAVMAGLIIAGSFALCAAAHIIPYTTSTFFKPSALEEKISKAAELASTFSMEDNRFA